MSSPPNTESFDKRELEQVESENEDVDLSRSATVNNYHGLSAKIITVYAVCYFVMTCSVPFADQPSVSESDCLCSIAEPGWCSRGMYLPHSEFASLLATRQKLLGGNYFTHDMLIIPT
jgi:hypothetical protein